jgi:hypothetical protein
MRTLKLSGRILGTGVALGSDVATAADDAPVWVQVAREGTWKGHQAGEFTFDQKFFDQVIANFRAHPAYQSGPDGKGAQPVVPFDYEHASELDPTSGTIPTSGAPAPAWALDLEVRKGADGLELWALADLGDQAREQIKAGEYRWTSVAVWKNAIDPVSGKSLGPVITSIAFTNKPFIQGMAPMTARVEVWGKAESSEEFVVGLRDVLELPPDAEAAAVKAELGDLVAAYREGRRGPAFPEGVGWLLDQVRRLLGLRALATADEIVMSAGQALDALSGSPSNTSATPTEGNDAMSEKVQAQLATIYGVQDKEDAIIAAATKAAGAMAVLNDMMKKFGASDPGDLVTKADAALTEASKAKDFATKLNEALAMLDQVDNEKAEEEVEQIAASLGLSDDAKTRLKPVLLAQRKEAGKSKETLEAFRKQYPVRTQQQQLLTTPVVAGPGGLQLGGGHTALPGRTPVVPTQQPQAQPMHPLLGYPGRNNTEKAVAYLTAKQPGFKELPRVEQIRQAGEYIRGGAPILH